MRNPIATSADYKSATERVFTDIKKYLHEEGLLDEVPCSKLHLKSITFDFNFDLGTCLDQWRNNQISKARKDTLVELHKKIIIVKDVVHV